MAKSMELYGRINARMHTYIDAVNSRADPELIHTELRDLVAEAIKMDITLEELMHVFSSTIEASGSKEFENNVAKRYAQEQRRVLKKQPN